ncbi:MAG TPA: Spy/CpxP family protein refolding chaperone [Candidatus Binatus sp.]
MKRRRILSAREFQRFSNRNYKGVYIMILLKHPAACAASAAAALLGAIVLAGPLFAASGDFSQAAATKSPAAGEVVAQAAPPEMMAAPAPEAHGIASVEARITELHKKLHITDAQKTQWDDLAQVMRDNAQAMVELQKQRAANAKSLNAVEVVKSYGSVIEAHDAGMKKFIPAFEALYNSMSDAQKKVADSLFRSRARTAAKKEAKESK